MKVLVEATYLIMVVFFFYGSIYTLNHYNSKWSRNVKKIDREKEIERMEQFYKGSIKSNKNQPIEQHLL